MGTRTQELQNENKISRDQNFFSVSNIHAWTENMGSGLLVAHDRFNDNTSYLVTADFLYKYETIISGTTKKVVDSKT